MSGTANPAYKHGHTAGAFSPEYHSWSSMIQRCTNPKRSMYRYYGGRGIAVDPAWMDFEAFLVDMGPRPLGLSLDRIDNDLGYTKDNCRWADSLTQRLNSSQIVRVTIGGTTNMLIEWCKIYNISINTVRDRVRFYGFSYEEAITTPVQRRPGESLRRNPKERNL